MALFVEREGGPYERSGSVVAELEPSSEYWLRVEVAGDSVSVDLRAGSTQGAVVGSTMYEYGFPFGAPTFVGGARRGGAVFGGSVDCVHFERNVAAPPSLRTAGWALPVCGSGDSCALA